MIRRDLLTVSVSLTDPSTCLKCPVREAIVANTRTATQDGIIRELVTGEPIKKTKGGPGIELLLNEVFRLPTDDKTQQLRDAMHRASRQGRDR
jgi:hypothetical protein